MKNRKGITLISLIITIIILIILAGIAVNLSLGENGLFNKAKYAKEETNKQTATEKINLKITTAQVNKYTEEQRMPTLKELSLALGKDKEIEYVTEKSQIASTKYEVGESPSSIFTKLNEYPYEFEINGQLQLASINGIKIATNNKGNSNILWEGTSTEGCEIELNDNLGNYEFIEVYFRNINSSASTCAILKFDTSEIISSGKIHIYNCSGGWNYGSFYSYDNKDNKIKNTGNECTGGSTYKYYTKFALEIYKIVGIN